MSSTFSSLVCPTSGNLRYSTRYEELERYQVRLLVPSSSVSILTHQVFMSLGSKKPLLTSAMPGHTKKLSERLRLSSTHPIYAIDSPGVMIPFFGHGDQGKERGVRLALVAGIKESLYDEETLASYLLWSMWRENPHRQFQFLFSTTIYHMHPS